MKVFESKEDVRAKVLDWKKEGLSVGLVPTMGFLHKGHLSLMDIAAAGADRFIVSIFVNPTQFAEGEDLESYPSNIERDLELCRERGAALVFKPSPDEVYGPDFQSYVSLEKIPHHLCGISRPSHFRGVATVVSKLFNICQPDLAVFGEKDFQQLALIRQLVQDLDFPVKVIGGPIVREADGLAMSSRNSYLSSEERKSALCLFLALQDALESVKKGEKNAESIIERAGSIVESYPFTKIDYISICDPLSLEALKSLNGPALMALAVWVGKTRLIDNAVLQP